MSDRYGANEPPTQGKVVLHTSIGPLDVELWPKDAPLAVRNFVQLCMERFYDDLPFHRVVKSFLAQTGDPDGTGFGGDSIYGGPFKDEIHSRLKFNRAGLLAMASKENKRDSNLSQFFITLGECQWLNKQNTIFGKVTGDSIYNLQKFGQIEIGDDDRPVVPEPRILSTEILANPFDDIVPRKSRFEIVEEGKRKLEKYEAKRKRKERKQLKKQKKNLKLMSFGDEEDEVETGISIRNDALKTSSVERDEAVQEREVDDRKEKKRKKGHEKETLRKEKEQVGEKRKLGLLNDGETKRKSKQNANEMQEHEEMLQKVRELEQNIREDKSQEMVPEKKLSAYDERRAKYATRKERGKSHQKDTLKLLKKFKARLAKVDNNSNEVAVPSTKMASHGAEDSDYKGGIGENAMEAEQIQYDSFDKSWMATELRFKRHIDDNFRFEQDEITVLDSRTEGGLRELQNLKDSN